MADINPNRASAVARTLPASVAALSGSNPASPLGNSFGALVIEIAARLEPLAVILKRHNIDKAQFTQLRRHPIFTAALAEQNRAFNGLHNTADRVRLKAQLITEELLDHMYSIAAHPAFPPSSRVAAFAQIKQLTGMDKPDNVAPPQKFSLTINLGDRKLTVEALQSIQDTSSAVAGDGDDADLPLDLPNSFYDEEADEADDEQSTLPSPPPPPGGWNSFTAQPGPELNHPGPPVFTRREGKSGSATQIAVQHRELDEP